MHDLTDDDRARLEEIALLIEASDSLARLCPNRAERSVRYLRKLAEQSSGEDRQTVARNARETRANGRRLADLGERMLREADDLERSLAAGPTSILRGRESTDTLAKIVKPGQRFHYEDLLGLLRAEGHTVAGADPAGSLLAALSRSTTFKVTAPRSGIYRRVA